MQHAFRLIPILALALASCTATEKSEPLGAKPASPAPAPAAAAGEHKAITTDALEPYECGSITRLNTFGGIFLASQPQPADFEQSKKGGVRTVINLRHESEIKEFDERATIAGLGLNYVNVPWDGAEELSDEVFDRTRQLLNTAERPILMHCSSGNRVGAVWAVWRALDGGLSMDEALTEAKTVGLKTPAYEEKARDYVRRKRG